MKKLKNSLISYDFNTILEALLKYDDFGNSALSYIITNNNRKALNVIKKYAGSHKKQIKTSKMETISWGFELALKLTELDSEDVKEFLALFYDEEGLTDLLKRNGFEEYL